MLRLDGFGIAVEKWPGAFLALTSWARFFVARGGGANNNRSAPWVSPWRGAMRSKGLSKK